QKAVRLPRTARGGVSQIEQIPSVLSGCRAELFHPIRPAVCSPVPQGARLFSSFRRCHVEPSRECVCQLRTRDAWIPALRRNDLALEEPLRDSSAPGPIQGSVQSLSGRRGPRRGIVFG